MMAFLQLPSCAEFSVNTPDRIKLLNFDQNDLKKSDILGRGSYGTVIKGIYKEQNVAVKILNTTNDKKSNALKNESNILGWKHENIIEILKIVDEPTFGMVIMERFPGQCLQFIVDNVNLSLFHSCHILLDLSNALSYCHHRNLVHLDVKPQNILISFHENIYERNEIIEKLYTCKLCDFGTSTYLNKIDVSKEFYPKGTVRYMAPEVLTTSQISPASDIYSLGITAWQLEANQSPYYLIDNNDTVAYRVIKEKLRPTSPEFELSTFKFTSPIKQHSEFSFSENFYSKTLRPRHVQQNSADKTQRILFNRRNATRSLTPSKFSAEKSPFRNLNLNLNLRTTDFEKNISDVKIKNSTPKKKKNSLYISVDDAEKNFRKDLRAYFESYPKKFPPKALKSYKMLYEKCWETEMSKRPTACDILINLNEILSMC